MRIANIQRFCMHDGPGIRTTVFFKGCPLRCLWCHNPETQKSESEILFYASKCIGCRSCEGCPEGAHVFSPDHALLRGLCVGCGVCSSVCPASALELSGTDYSERELLEIIERDLPFYSEGGGVTLSGGEPFLQSEDALSLLRLCKARGLDTAVETCGFFSSDILPTAVPLVDLFLWDIKDTAPERHKKYTGADNGLIISNLLLADSLGAKTRLRCILIKGINTDPVHYDGIAKIYTRLKCCEGTELIPYHSFGESKLSALGKSSALDDSRVPTHEDMECAKAHLRKAGVNVI